MRGDCIQVVVSVRDVCSGDCRETGMCVGGGGTVGRLWNRENHWQRINFLIG